MNELVKTHLVSLPMFLSPFNLLANGPRASQWRLLSEAYLITLFSAHAPDSIKRMDGHD